MHLLRTIVWAALPALACSVCMGCGSGANHVHGQPKDRLDAEEYGYLLRVGPKIERWKSGDLAGLMRVARTNWASFEQAKGRGQQAVWIDNTEFKYKARLLVDPASLEAIDPPASFAKLHHCAVAVAKAMRECKDREDETRSNRQKYPTQTLYGYDDRIADSSGLPAVCKSFADAADEFLQEDARMTTQIRNRSATLVQSSSLKVEFQPKGLPISYDVASGKISVSCAVDVGVGQFVVSEAEHPGLKYLVIKNNGRARHYYIVGRRLEIPVAASLLRIEGETITLDADAVSRP
jgi:hypothetical protein